MSHSKASNKGPRGFIAIVSLGVFALLAVFGIIISTVSTNTIQSIKNTNKYYEARDVADSVMEYLQYELNDKASGYSIETKTCTFGEYIETYDPQTIQENLNNIAGVAPQEVNLVVDNDGTNCNDISGLVGLSEKNALVQIEIKGKSTDDQSFSNCPGLAGEATCFVVPTPGTGDAGEDCQLFNTEFNGAATLNVAGLDVSYLDHPCNWNKLLPGSSATDRVSIPFFHQIVTDNGPMIVNPFNLAELGGVNGKFILRMRAPCPDNAAACANADRLKLDDTEENNVVVQWQLSGKCTENDANGVIVKNADGTQKLSECGFIQNYDESAAGTANNSAIFESVVNGGIAQANASNAVLYGLSKIDSTDSDGNLAPQTVLLNLTKMKEPSLTLFLSDSLVNKANPSKSITHLEYQLLSNKKIADPKITMDVTINIDGNIFKKTLYKSEQKPLIDFAVQN